MVKRLFKMAVIFLGVFKSLVGLSPRIDFVTPLPWIVRFHMVNAFVLIGLFPFTRLVHIFTIPLSYLWRPYQVAIWYRTGRNKMGRMDI